MDNFKRTALLLIIFFLPLNSFGQRTLNQNHEMNMDVIRHLNTMGMKYSPPAAGFTGKYNRFFHKSAPSIYEFGTIMNSYIESDEGDFVALYYISFVVTEEFLSKVDRLFPDSNKFGVDDHHCYLLKNSKAVKESIQYYPQDEVRARFNADTVILFSLDMRGEKLAEKFLPEQYGQCKGLLLQKKGFGYMAMFCFYNEERAWEKNRPVVESLFRYK